VLRSEFTILFIHESPLPSERHKYYSDTPLLAVGAHTHSGPWARTLGRRSRAPRLGPRAVLSWTASSSSLPEGNGNVLLTFTPSIRTSLPQAGARGNRCRSCSRSSHVASDGDKPDHWINAWRRTAVPDLATRFCRIRSGTCKPSSESGNCSAD